METPCSVKAQMRVRESSLETPLIGERHVSRLPTGPRNSRCTPYWLRTRLPNILLPQSTGLAVILNSAILSLTPTPSAPLLESRTKCILEPHSRISQSCPAAGARSVVLQQCPTRQASAAAMAVPCPQPGKPAIRAVGQAADNP
jgi:hypothetical protein